MNKQLPSSWIFQKAGSWRWHLAEKGILEPWFVCYQQYEQYPVKKNPLRCVFRVKNGDDREYFIKHDNPKGIIPCLKSCFRSKSAAELFSFIQLSNAGIPCVRYVGYGVSGRESMLITEA